MLLLCWRQSVDLLLARRLRLLGLALLSAWQSGAPPPAAFVRARSELEAELPTPLDQLKADWLARA